MSTDSVQTSASMSQLFLDTAVGNVLLMIDVILATLANLHDILIYKPLEVTHAPLLHYIPRVCGVGKVRVHLFTANNISFFRTALVVPLAICLSLGAFVLAFFIALTQGYLAQLYGIVFKVQRQKYGNLDDPIFGGVLHEFCGKIICVLSLWSILMRTSYSDMSLAETITWSSIIGFVIGHGFIMGLTRVQDYFQSGISGSSTVECKLTETLQSTGVALLCLAVGYGSPISGIAGIGGLSSLILTLRWPNASLKLKIKAQKSAKSSSNGQSVTQKKLTIGNEFSNLDHQGDSLDSNSQNKDGSDEEEELQGSGAPGTWESLDDLLEEIDHKDTETIAEPDIMSAPNHIIPVERFAELDFDMETQDDDNDDNNNNEVQLPNQPNMSGLLQYLGLSEKVDKVYTIGCFDLFHRGHVILMMRMRAIGKTVIVGIHDSRSIYKLKSKAPVQVTKTRMTKLKEYADEVFVICDTDPNVFMECIIHLEPGETAMYIRGDDMPNFPGREVVEKVMPVWLVPYTFGISSTELRRKFYPHIPLDTNDDLR